jgi:hypothetical protein
LLKGRARHTRPEDGLPRKIRSKNREKKKKFERLRDYSEEDMHVVQVVEKFNHIEGNLCGVQFLRMASLQNFAA